MMSGAAIDELRGKQKAFVLHYLANGFNQTRAYEAAGYKGDENTLAVGASKLVRNHKVQAAIKELMTEMAMPAEEALARLAMMARGDIGEFAGKSETDLVTHPKSMLIHTVKRRTIPQRSGEPITELEYKLYDAQSAIVQILRQHQLAEGKPTEIVKLYENVSPDDWDETDTDE